MDSKVKLIIEAATDQAKQKVQGFAQASSQGFEKVEQSAKKLTQGLADTWNKAKSAWVEIGATALALKKGFDLMNQAAKFKERETAFANIAASHGANAEKIIADLKQISNGTIDTMTLMEKAGTAMTLGIQADKLDEMMKIARASSKITGQTVSEAYSDITLAVGRQSKMILDNLGIIVRVEDANEKYAAALGKTAKQLTDAEKKQAFLNATLEAGENIVKRVGAQQDTAAERIQRYQARWKDAAIWIGRVFLNVGQGIEFVFAAAGSSVNRIYSIVAGKLAKIASYTERMPGFIGKIGAKLKLFFKGVEENAKGAADKGVAHMHETFEALTAVWQKSEPIRTKVKTDFEDQGKAAEKAAEKVKKLLGLQKTDAQKRADAIETMYRESGINADAYYQEEINSLTERARQWQEAGVRIEDINRYMYDRIEKLEEDALQSGEYAVSDWLGHIKHHADTLVADLKQKDAAIQAEIKAIADNVKSLDGSEIGIQVKLYDDNFYSDVAKIKASLAQIGGISIQGTGKATVYEGDKSSETSWSGSQSGTGSVTFYEGDRSVNVNVSQSISRSDINNIVAEQKRQAERN